MCGLSASKLVPVLFSMELFSYLLSTAISVLCTGIRNEVQMATVLLCGNYQQRYLK